MTTLRAQAVSRVFETAGEPVHAVQDVTLEVAPGELLVVTGPSGAGKTTLLNLLGGLDRPTSGRVFLGDDELSALGENELAAVRRDRLGYVFQSFGLIPVLSAAENVELPLRIQKTPPAERDERVREALRLVGLSGHADQRPGEHGREDAGVPVAPVGGKRHDVGKDENGEGDAGRLHRRDRQRQDRHRQEIEDAEAALGQAEDEHRRNGGGVEPRIGEHRMRRGARRAGRTDCGGTIDRRLSDRQPR